MSDKQSNVVYPDKEIIVILQKVGNHIMWHTMNAPWEH